MSEMSRRDLANACYYTQEGSWTGNSVHLEGIVLLSNNPAFVGVRVTTDGHSPSGGITWTFDDVVFTGSGLVLHT